MSAMGNVGLPWVVQRGVDPRFEVLQGTALVKVPVRKQYMRTFQAIHNQQFGEVSRSVGLYGE
jgi:hypothetical protein